MLYIAWSLPLLSGIADAAYRVVIKSSRVHNFILNAWGFLFTLPYYFIWLAVLGVPSIQPQFWLIILLVLPLGILGVVLQVESHRLSPLNLTAPYLSLTPAYSLVTTPLLSYFFPVLNRSWPTMLGGIGVGVLTLGIYLLNQERGAGFLAPFRQLKKERGSMYMLLVGFIWSITANLDFVGMNQSNPAFYVLLNHGFISLASFFLAYLYLNRGKIPAEEKAGPGFLRITFIYGTGIALSMILHLVAYLWIPEVPYVIAGKRAGTMFFALLLGIAAATFGGLKERFADEKKNLGMRILGTSLMVAGMLIVIFYGKSA